MADIVEQFTDEKKKCAKIQKRKKNTRNFDSNCESKKKNKENDDDDDEEEEKAQPSTSRRLRLFIAKHISAQPIETFILDTNDATERKNPPEIWTVSLF